MPRHLSVMLLLLVGSPPAIAACGSSGTSSAAGSAAPQGVAYVGCMRSHGVPNLPDPGPEGAVQLGPSSGVNTSSPAFKAAQASCAKLLPGGGPSGPGPASEQVREHMLAVSKCMRAEGVSGFPDPTVGLLPANPQQFAIAMGRRGVSLLVPNTIDVSSPAFKRAAATCRFGALFPAGQRTPAP